MFFDNEDAPGLVTKAAKRRPEGLRTLEYPPKDRKIISLREAAKLPFGSVVMLDTEFLPNFAFVGFKHIDTQQYFYTQLTPADKPDTTFIHWALFYFCCVTFNGRNYDIPQLMLMIGGASTEALKAQSDAIILAGERTRWHNMKDNMNHVDLAEVTPLQGSLKLYGARLHAPRIQEMPVDPHEPITPEMSRKVALYCYNDLDNTEVIWNEVKQQIVMRESIGAQVKEDVRSRSDAQVAEVAISKEYERITGKRPYPPKEIDFTPVRYNPPSYLQFRTPEMQQILERMKEERFNILPTGYVSDDNLMKNLSLKLGNGIFRMSIGGLHSSETNVCMRSDENNFISDFDVASYYPKIILNGGIYPKSMGPVFLDIFRAIVDRRLNAKEMAKVAKKNGLKEDAIRWSVEADGLKITVNGTFGKLGNMYSIMYSPELMLYVTLTGQLTLLLLIEAAAIEGIHIVSANTDGVVFHYPRTREADMKRIIKTWEQQTAFEMEETRYAGYFARDVNNYMTLKADGEWKTKGAYCERGSAQNSPLSRNPETFICVDAVKSFIQRSVPIEETIRSCNDWRRFVTVRNVRGGAHKDGWYLGKTIRWYYASNERGAIYSILTGNKVPNTDGAKPFMEANETPSDIDYKWYVDKSFDMLNDIGYFGRNEKQTLL